jgi:glycosyltransferase involved in cell wall biosynthesis
MIEALDQLPGFELAIVGEGPERGAIEALAHKRRVAERVRFLGRLPQDRLPDIYTAADMLLLVSAHEGWPNVLLESMACGTPVVVSNIDGIADIVAAPEAGRILAEATTSGLAGTVRELITALPARAATRAYAEQFDWQSTIEGQLALFREICDRHSHKQTLVQAA